MNLKLMRMLNKLHETAGAEGSATSSSSTPAAPAASATDTGSSAASSLDSGSSSSEGGNEFDFAALATFDDSGDATDSLEPAKPAVPAAAAPVGQPSTTPPSPAPATPAAPAAAPVPTEPTATAPVQPPAPGQPAEPLQTPEQMFQKHRETYLPQIRKLYELTPEEVELSRTNPEQFFPDMAAKLHYEVQMAAHNGLVGVMPGMIEHFLQQREASTKANDKFYSKWTKLKEAVAADPKKEETIRQAIKAYKNANPNADMDMVINQAGMLAMISLGIPLEIPGVQQQPTAPAAPVPPRSLPPRPAGAGSVAHVPVPAAGGTGSGDEGNIFSDLYEATMRGEI